MSSYAPVPEGTSREAMLILDREIEEGDSAEELRAPDNSSERPNKVKVIALTAGVLAALVGVVLFMLSDPCRSPLAVFRGHGIEMVEMKQLEAASRNLKSVKSRTAADQMVREAMSKAREERIAHHKIHKLGMPKGLRKMVGSGATQIGDYFHSEKLAVEARKAEIGDIGWTAQKKAEYWGGGQLERSENFRQAFCVFNVAETIDSLGGTGIDVDAIVRTCPEPRNDISDFACAVNAETLAEMVGTAATWLSSAVSTCDTFPNVGAECASGVAGILGALGEVAASGTLAMTSCKQYPLAGFKADQYSRDAKIDSAGHSTMRISQVANHGPPERRLFMGAGLMGTGVQCGVDIGFIVDNIYDTIFYIQQAVSISSCSKHTRYGPYNYLTGVPEAACAMDISGAIAWITRIATFVQQLISHCPDILELPTLCGSSATGLLSSASQIASWGSQVAIACGESESVAVIPRVIAFKEKYNTVRGREVEFVKLCNHWSQAFDIQCTWVSERERKKGGLTPQATFVGPYEGLLLAEAQIKDEGLRLPGFKPFTYLTTVRRPHGTGVRRLGESEKAAPVESAATEEALEEADRKWDPENHPSMRNLRMAMKELYQLKANMTGDADVSAAKRATREDLKERLHLIEPALKEFSSEWSIENLDTC